MPPDSPYILNNISDTASWPDSLATDLQAVGRPGEQKSSGTLMHVSSRKSQDNTIPWAPIGFVFGLMIFSLLVRYLRYKVLRKKISRIYEEKKFVYDNILCSNNPYYKSLGTDNKDRFIWRTIFFMQAKKFRYIDIEEEEKIPLLISATAIQLTFGLDNYLLNYFKTIYVMRDNYRFGFSPVPFEGHVSEDGIYLSWNNFIREYNDYSDGENVGLHEMAHALTYVNFTAQDGIDNSFKKKFYEFSPIARPIFNRMQQGETNLLDKYAATNYEEFWAVCIETFFERPFPFREKMPDLYFALCRLLNQDPTTTGKILSS